MLEGESPNRRTATVWTFIITDGIFFVNRFFCFYTPFLSKTRRLPNQETAVRIFTQSRCSGGNLPPATLRIQPVRLNDTTPPVHPADAVLLVRLDCRYVAGGRLPPLRYNCYKYRIFYVSNVGLSFRIMEKTWYIAVGAVLRAANQNLLIAGGNHTLISSAICRPPRFEHNLFGQTEPPTPKK